MSAEQLDLNQTLVALRDLHYWQRPDGDDEALASWMAAHRALWPQLVRWAARPEGAPVADYVQQTRGLSLSLSGWEAVHRRGEELGIGWADQTPDLPRVACLWHVTRERLVQHPSRTIDRVMAAYIEGVWPHRSPLWSARWLLAGMRAGLQIEAPALSRVWPLAYSGADRVAFSIGYNPEPSADHDSGLRLRCVIGTSTRLADALRERWPSKASKELLWALLSDLTPVETAGMGWLSANLGGHDSVALRSLAAYLRGQKVLQ